MTDKAKEKETRLQIYLRVLEAFGTDNPAKVARELGITRQSVYGWRDGKGSPTLEKITQVARLTGRSVNWLLTGNEESPESRPFKGNTLSDLYKLLSEYMKLSAKEREMLSFVRDEAIREIEILKSEGASNENSA